MYARCRLYSRRGIYYYCQKFCIAAVVETINIKKGSRVVPTIKNHLTLTLVAMDANYIIHGPTESAPVPIVYIYI